MSAVASRQTGDTSVTAEEAVEVLQHVSWSESVCNTLKEKLSLSELDTVNHNGGIPCYV